MEHEKSRLSGDGEKYQKLKSQFDQQEITFQRALKELQKSREAERAKNARLSAEIQDLKSRDDIARLGEQLLEANRRVEQADEERERAVSEANQLQVTYNELAEKYKSERKRYTYWILISPTEILRASESLSDPILIMKVKPKTQILNFWYESRKNCPGRSKCWAI